MPHLKGMQNISITELKKDLEYGVKIYSLKIERSKIFYMGLEFETTNDPRNEIDVVENWDGTGGEESITTISFQ